VSYWRVQKDEPLQTSIVHNRLPLWVQEISNKIDLLYFGKYLIESSVFFFMRYDLLTQRTRLIEMPEKELLAWMPTCPEPYKAQK
jgi:hypothetical protein